MVNPYHNNFYNPQAAYQPQFFGQYMQQPRFQQPAQPEQTAQQQMVQQQPFQRVINGMMVASADNITADCVPMDGSAAFFPKHDLSEIYVKNWCADGTIHTLTFKPISEPQASDLSKNDLESNLRLSDAITGLFENKFNELSEKIDRLEQFIAKPVAKNRTSTAKKDGESE